MDETHEVPFIGITIKSLGSIAKLTPPNFKATTF